MHTANMFEEEGEEATIQKKRIEIMLIKKK